MQRYTTIQQGMAADFSLPYPFHVFEDGRVDRQDFWKGRVARVIGFQADLNEKTIDLFWADAVNDPQRAVGMYVVTADTNGYNAKWSVWRSAIRDVSVIELDERYTVEGQGVIGTGETLEEAKKDFKRFGGRLGAGYTATHYLGSRDPEVTEKKARAGRA